MVETSCFLWYLATTKPGHEKHNQLRAAYSYWNVANTVPLQDGHFFFARHPPSTSLGKFLFFFLDVLGFIGFFGFDGFLHVGNKNLRLAQLGKPYFRT